MLPLSHAHVLSAFAAQTISTQTTDPNLRGPWDWNFYLPGQGPLINGWPDEGPSINNGPDEGAWINDWPNEDAWINSWLEWLNDW
jgi:hypothetical protein